MTAEYRLVKKMNFKPLSQKKLQDLFEKRIGKLTIVDVIDDNGVCPDDLLDKQGVYACFGLKTYGITNERQLSALIKGGVEYRIRG